AGLAFHLSPWGAKASLVMLDAGFGILRAIAPGKSPDDILIVGLHDAATVAEVGSAGPGLRQLPDVLVRIARGRPRAIALHARLPRASQEAAAPGWDDALATALSVAQAAAPLAVGMSVDSRREVVPIHDALLRGVDTQALVFTLLPRDEDGVVRQIVLALPTQQGKWPTSAGWLCAVLGGKCEPGLIDYALGPAYRYLPAQRLLDIRDDTALARLFRGRVVFVAPVTGPDDRVPQPVSLAGWEPPSREPAAVLAHAQTVRTLLHGNPIHEAPLPAMLLATAAAALVALIAAPVAPAVGALAAGGCIAGALFALRLGWYAPPAAVLATLVAAVVASRILGRMSHPARGVT
ncbi:MAG TPA: CHASE2 domain-containing protein, partial [Usitatibacteraceae bacterium]|nr:CHASE2 domain-containing protein [Usitatibacteraceae bacterium]